METSSVIGIPLDDDMLLATSRPLKKRRLVHIEFVDATKTPESVREDPENNENQIESQSESFIGNWADCSYQNLSECDNKIRPINVSVHHEQGVEQYVSGFTVKDAQTGAVMDMNAKIIGSKLIIIFQLYHI